MRTRTLRYAATLAAVATTTALAAGAGAGPATGATKVSCSTKGTTLAIGTGARVFASGTGSARRVYGCTTNAGKPRNLGRAGGEGVVTSTVRVTGPRAAYAISSCGDTGCQQSVLVHDLKTNKRVSAGLSAPRDVDQRVTDVVLGTAGTVAWIAEEQAGGGAATARYVSTRKPGAFTGIPVVPIATGLDIVAGSLALAGNTLYWTQGAAARAAALG